MGTKKKLEGIHGKPTNIVCWLVGGHFGNPPSIYGIAYNAANLRSEIEMMHYENPIAKAQGVQILGITEQGPDDTRVVEHYKLVFHSKEAPYFAVYVCAEDRDAWLSWESDPDKMVASFKRAKSYDLPDNMLDPKNMPGSPRQIDV